MNIEPIAKIRTDFKTKFGIPRQSGIVKELSGTIIFEKKYRDPNAIRGLDGFSHIWVIWGFSENVGKEYSPTVRPPKLGGNERMGVFATRSPFRPNGLGISCLKLDKIETSEKYGHVLHVFGADMVDSTPIFDIKPYLSYTDSIADATCGFISRTEHSCLTVNVDSELLDRMPRDKADILIKILAEDPRPSYIEDDERIYGFPFSDYEIKFRVCGNELTVTDIEKRII